MTVADAKPVEPPAYGPPDSDARPEPMSWSPWPRVWEDLTSERRARVPFPPGHTNPSLARTRQMANDPLGLLLASYKRFGPIFSLRILYARLVFMLGPAANQYVTVSHPHNFHWREGSFGDLI